MRQGTIALVVLVGGTFAQACAAAEQPLLPVSRTEFVALELGTIPHLLERGSHGVGLPIKREIGDGAHTSKNNGEESDYDFRVQRGKHIVQGAALGVLAVFVIWWIANRQTKKREQQ